MRVLYRVVYAPSIVNRAPLGLKVVPKYPDIEKYEDYVYDGIDRKEYEDILYAKKTNLPIRAYTSSILPKEIGYIIGDDRHAYAVPVGSLKGFMHDNKVKKIDASKNGLWIELVKGHVVIHNNPPCIESAEIVFIYYTDVNGYEETRIPVDRTFRIQGSYGVKRIQCKGDATVYGLKLVNEELLDMTKGMIVDVSRYGKYNKS